MSKLILQFIGVVFCIFSIWGNLTHQGQDLIETHEKCDSVFIDGHLTIDNCKKLNTYSPKYSPLGVASMIGTILFMTGSLIIKEE